MIKLWLYSKDCLHYPVYNRIDRMLKDGTIVLSSVQWYDRPDCELGDTKIGLDFLTKGFKI